MVDGVEGAEIHFNFVAGPPEHRRAAPRAEMTPGIFACLSLNRHCNLIEDRRRVKQGSMVLPAIEAVADADALRLAYRGETDIAAEAAAAYRIHLS